MPRTRNTGADAPTPDAPETDAPTPDAPETDAPTPDAPEGASETDAPERVHGRGLASAARTEHVEKGARVYDVQSLTPGGDVVPSSDAPDGSLLLSVPDVDAPNVVHAIQRERRADGSHGEMLACIITRVPGKPGAPARENVARYPLATLEAFRLAFTSADVPLFD